MLENHHRIVGNQMHTKTPGTHSDRLVVVFSARAFLFQFRNIHFGDTQAVLCGDTTATHHPCRGIAHRRYRTDFKFSIRGPPTKPLLKKTTGCMRSGLESFIGRGLPSLSDGSSGLSGSRANETFSGYSKPRP